MGGIQQAETSLAAWREERGRLRGRSDRIMKVFEVRRDRALCCRDVLDAIEQEDHLPPQDMNYVRPRVTELAKRRLIRLSPDRRKDRVSGHLVEAWQYWPAMVQMDLI